jgi:hypothetical protein
MEFLGDANNPSALDVVAFAVLRNLSTVFLCYWAALILGSDFFTGAVLAAMLAKLVLRFDDLSQDKASSNTLRVEVR